MVGVGVAAAAGVVVMVVVAAASVAVVSWLSPGGGDVVGGWYQ